MANTYKLISSSVLSTSASSFTFSSIPATFTDLVLKTSVRSDVSNVQYDLQVSMNSTGGTSHSYTLFRGYSPSGDTFRGSSVGYILGNSSGGGATANTFGNSQMYIPNYAGSTFKPASFNNANETNASTIFLYTTAGLFNSTSAITSIILTSPSYNFVSGSSFYLYGVKNS
jgi:hypothetical protein